MADNTRGGSQDSGDPLIATDEVTYSGDTADVQLVRLVNVTGSEGSKTVEAISDGTNGLDVDVTRLPALVAGTANIGDVDVASIAAGDNNIGNVDVVTLPALVAGTANIGDVDVLTLPALPAGNNNIGDVDIASALPAGTNNIGDVDVLTLPALPAGNNNIGDVDVATLPNVTLAAGTNTNEVVGDVAHDIAAAGNPVLVGGYASATAPSDVSANGDAVRAWLLRNGATATVVTAAGALIGGDATNGLDVDVTRLPALVAGTANIGDVDVLTLPALPAGNNNIGDVDVVTLPNVTLAAGTNTNEVVGDAAQDVAIAGNPVAIGMRASTAIPTAMSADGDVVYPWANRNGAQIVSTAPHVGLNSDPFGLTGKTAQYTSTQTGVALVTPTGGKKLVVTKVQIQAGGTTAGTMQLWFGASGDTTYTRGTDLAIFDGEFAPSATLKPGVVMDGPFIASTADHLLRVTESANINPLTVTVWYYEI